jgi:hypothetical protein
MLSAFAPETIRVHPRRVEKSVRTDGISVPGIRRDRKSPPAAVITTISVIRGFVIVTRSRTVT